jgi:cation diffusion facilitator family transporter
VRPIESFEFPDDKKALFKRAQRLEIITILYIASAATALYLTMGSSQAMRASFFEDVISVIPAILFLICTRIALWPPNRNFPYGFHGAVSIGYLLSSIALIGMGLFLLIEAASKFLSGERTTIGGMHIFGETIWAGWPMLAAVAYTGIPSVILGHMKLKLAPKLHDKILYADAKMMKADWMAESATAIGVLGAGFGYWWIDPLAGGIIALDILKDGISNLFVVIADLIERRPRKTDQSGYESMPDDLRRRIESLDWVKEAEVRLRESGHILLGEVYVVPKLTDNLPERVSGAIDDAKQMHWRLHDVAISVVPHLRDASPAADGQR